MQTAGLTPAVAAPSRCRSARRPSAACAVAGAVPVYSGMRRCGAVDLASSGRVSSGRACLAAAVATSTRRAARGGPTRLATTAMFEVRHCVPASRVQGRRASAQRQGGLIALKRGRLPGGQLGATGGALGGATPSWRLHL